MINVLDSYRPYSRKIFVWLFFTFVLVLVIGNVTLYVIRTKHLFSETQQSLMKVAEDVAAKIPVDVHEQLVKPEQQQSSEYIQIETYITSVMDGNPNIDDIYTLRPTEKPHIMSFVVSGKPTEDANGNGIIEDSEMKANLGEEYNTSSFSDLEAGLKAPSVDQSFTYDQWGTWISGYAPLKDKAGKSIAIVGIDLSATVINAQRAEVRRSILYADLITLPIIILIAILLAWKLGRPFKILALGMDRVAHGDFTDQLPVTGRGEERHFAELFNSMIAMFSTKVHEQNSVEKKDKK